MNVLLIVSGSISAYKSYDLLRLYVKNHHHVKVVLTKGALSFVKANVFKYLGAEEVYLPQDDFNYKEKGVLHVDLVKWADKCVIAPLSAGLLNRLGKGSATDLAACLFLAWIKKKTMLMFPAMNTEMYSHPLVQKNLNDLKKYDWVKIIEPSSGKLACGDEGIGKLAPIEVIEKLTETLNHNDRKKEIIVITTGSTVSPIDSVRFVTNPSSGLTGILLARQFLKHGHQVHLLKGHQTVPAPDLDAHPNCITYETPTTQEMLRKAKELFPKAQLYLSAAAVADIEFEAKNEKIKKENLHQLPFKRAVDILAEVLKMKKKNQKVVSFAAETDTTPKIFNEKMKRKPVDLMIGNKVNNGLVAKSKLEGFVADHGLYYFITANKISTAKALIKDDLAEAIYQWYSKGKLL